MRPSYKRIRVVRVETTDNEKIVGLLVPNAEVGSVLQGLSLSFSLSITHKHDDVAMNINGDFYL